MKSRPDRISIPPFGDFKLDQFEAYGVECFYYETRIAFDGTKIEIVVHPPDTPHSEWSAFVMTASSLIPEILKGWNQILATGVDQLCDLFTSYGVEMDGSDMRNLIPNLVPEMLQIHAEDDDEIAFVPTSHFPSLNLFVSFDSDWRVTKVRFDG